jgi:hypothetical protein
MVSGCWNWFHGNILLTTVFDVLFAFVDKFWKKRKNKKYHTVRTVPKSINRKTKNTTLSEHFLKSINRKIIETETKWIPLTHIYIHDHSLSGVGTAGCRSKLVLWHSGEMMCHASVFHKIDLNTTNPNLNRLCNGQKKKKRKYKQWSTKQ